jgi:hypothetical protein
MEYSYSADSICLKATPCKDLEPPIPHPLQIIKRVDTRQNIRTREASDSSGYSTYTGKSRGSVPSIPEDHLPLIIPKKRHVVRPIEPQKPTHPAEDRYLQQENKSTSPNTDNEATPKPRRATSCESPAAAAPDYLTELPALANKASMLFLGKRRPKVSLPLNGWVSPETETSSCITSSVFDIPEVAEPTVTVCLLMPKIRVTPERKVLDEGVTSL